jgi:threonine/homoserine/homoserine lactone efflux protein
MPDLPTYLAFLAALLAWQVAPGPDMMLVVSRGIGEGRRTALGSVVGMTLGAGLLQLPLLALGVASVARTPIAFEVLRWVGAAYLVWLGTRLILGSFRGRSNGPAIAGASRSWFGAVAEGMIANLMNPSPMLFMLAFLPQFVDPAEGSVTLQLLVLGSTQKATGFLLLGATALAAGAAGGWLARRRRIVAWQERFAGAAMILLGIRLLIDGRPTRG